jgi:hypothetical protein
MTLTVISPIPWDGIPAIPSYHSWEGTQILLFKTLLPPLYTAVVLEMDQTRTQAGKKYGEVLVGLI